MEYSLTEPTVQYHFLRKHDITVSRVGHPHPIYISPYVIPREQSDRGNPA